MPYGNTYRSKEEVFMKVTTIPAHEKIEYAKPKNVAAYCRVSTNQEIQLHSLAVQKAYFEKLIKSHIGWNLLESMLTRRRGETIEKC